MNGWWYLSTPRMTVAVRLHDGIVTDGPPIVRRFLGQPSRNLGRWLRKQGPLRMEQLR